MRLQDELNITPKVALLMVIVFLGMAAIGSIAYYYQEKANERIRGVYDDNLKPIQWLGQIRANHEIMAGNIYRIITLNDQSTIQDYVKMNLELRAKNDQLWSEYKAARLEPFEKEIVPQAETVIEEARAGITNFYNLAQEGRLEEARLYLKTTAPKSAEYGKYIEALTKFNADYAEQTKSQNENDFAYTTRVTIFSSLTIIIVVLLLGQSIVRGVTKPLSDLIEQRTQELVAANEELTAMNEELSAANEELTTMNEEIFALNENLNQLREVAEEANFRLNEQNIHLEEIVQQRTERLEKLLSAVPDVIFCCSDDGQFLDYQAEGDMKFYAQLSGLPGKSVFEVLPQALAEQFTGNIKKARATGKIQVLEYQIPIAGVRRYREARFIAGKVKDIFIIARDITERKQDEACDILLLDIANMVLDKNPLEKILRLLCERLVQIFDLVQAVVGLKEPDGSLKMLGAGIYTILADKFIVGRWDEAPEQLPAIGKVLLSGEPLIGQTREELLPWHIKALSQLGENVERFNSYVAIPLIVEGSIIGGLSLASRHEYFWDERLVKRLQHFSNQAAVAIVANEARQRLSLLHAGLEAAANAVMITDIHGTIQWINPAFKRLTGYEIHEVVGEGPRILSSGQQEETIYQRLWETITSGNVWTGELVNRRKDGTFYTAEITITPVTNEQGEIINFIAIQQDITEKIKAIEALIEAKEVRARAEKLFSLGTLAAGISHEINQPLNCIKIISSGIVYAYRKGKKQDVDEIIANVEEVSHQADRINSIVSHLRSFVRKDEKRTEKVDLNVAALQATGVIGKQLASHGVIMETHLGESLPPIMANITSLEEIIINLLVNSMQALDTIVSGEKRIILRTYYQDGGVVMKISDNGPGISVEKGEKIFEPFYSTKKEGENLGLGLAIVHSLVISCNGSISYNSDGKNGTAFLIKFPAVGA